jgi:hypothetical protein
MSYPLGYSRTRHTFLATLVGTTAVALAVVLGPAVAEAADVQLGPFTKVSDGDPFAACKADNVAKQEKAGSVLYPNTEIEPWIAANPANPKNVLASWQQDRWSDGGSRGGVAGVSNNGGSSWKSVIPGRVTKCEGGPWTRASDFWADFSTKGVAYFMHLAIEPDLPNGQFGASAMVVTRSTDGGQTWGKPITLIKDPNGQSLNDKNSITADPKDPDLAYAVWDRLTDFTVPPVEGGEPVVGGLDAATHKAIGMDGVELARAWHEFFKDRGEGEKAPTQVFFKGPTYFARTTDAGKTWEKARKIFDPGPNEQTLGNQIVVRPDGTLVDFFAHFLPTGVDRLELIRSKDKGKTWSRPTVATVMVTFGSVTPDKQEPIRDAANLFDVAVDPQNGNLYAVLQEYRYHGVEEVSFLMSTDGGDSWTTPARINQTPAPGKNPLLRQAIIPSVEVGPDGVLVVTYYDFRNDNNTGELADYWAVFCDPKKTNCGVAKNWGGEVRLTTKSFDYLNAPVARGHFLGDYMGLERAGDQVIPAFGIADGKNKTSIYTRRIIFGGKAEVASASGQ